METSLKSSHKSRLSKKSTLTQQIVDKIQSQGGEITPAYTNKLVDELIGTLKICNGCSSALSEDEKVINARFIQQAASNGQDISVFPICVKCNFE